MKKTAKKFVAGTVGAAGLFLASAAAAVSADSVHNVVKDDTVWSLSQKYGVSVKSIEQLNHINQNTNMIYVGQDLQIPNKGTQTPKNDTHAYVVQSGDSLWAIAQKFNMTVSQLKQLNGLTSNVIHADQTLKVTGQVATQPTKSSTTAPIKSVAQPQVQKSSAAKSPIASSVVQASASSAVTSKVTPAASSSSATVASSSQVQKQTPVINSNAQNSKQAVVSANHTTYTVKSGDSLYTIAQEYGVSVASLREANPNLGNSLTVGQSVIINNPAKNPVTASSQQSQASVTQQSSQVQNHATAPQQTQTQTSNNQSSHQNVQSYATTPQRTQAQAQTNNNQNNHQSVQNGNNNQQNNNQAVKSNPQPQQTSTTQTGSGNNVVSYAESLRGVPYVYGGTTPSGFDCSGFVQYVYNHFGKSLPRTTTQQENCGTQIPVSQAQPGDLYFWGNKGSAYHVAICVGNGKYIAAPEPGESVSVGSTQYFQPSFAVRM